MKSIQRIRREVSGVFILAFLLLSLSAWCQTIPVRPNESVSAKASLLSTNENVNELIEELKKEVLVREELEKRNSNKSNNKNKSLRVEETSLLLTDHGMEEKVSKIKIRPNQKLAAFSTDTIKSLLMPKVIYNLDNRREFHDLSPEDRAVVSGVACFIKKEHLIREGEYFVLSSDDFQTSKKTCDTEKFNKQPVPGFCTGFAVGGKALATAGHCLNDPLSSFFVVFDFHLISPNQPRTRFHKSQVFSPVRTIKSGLNRNTMTDFGLIELDRSVEQERVCQLDTDPVVVNDGLFVAGHPVGLPLKIAGGAQVLESSHANYFKADLDTYGGNSGSPVFNDNNQVVGILVRGERDFWWSPAKNCWYSNVCLEINYPNCEGEEVSRNSQFIQYLDNYLNTN